MGLGWGDDYTPVDMPPVKCEVFVAGDGDNGIRVTNVTQKEYDDLVFRVKSLEEALGRAILTEHFDEVVVHMVVGNSVRHKENEPCYICDVLK